ncbi:MAG: HisA/HisF-related TIM barrel protein [Patescibacteria group bacterium]|nr:HisA/HisF-related TIM barrel protein [Patescibacteria group bacterium]
MQIIPGILEKTWEEVEKKIETAKTFSKIIHIDIIDGKFAPNTTFLDPAPFKKYSNDFFFEVQLMVDEPINYLKPFANSGFKRFLGQIEKMSSQEEFIAQGQLLGEVGLAIDLPTPIDSIKVPFDGLDCLLFMSVKAGFSGQKFSENILEKIRSARQKTSIPIEIDGGVNEENIKRLLESGVNRFIATSAIFGSDNPLNQYRNLQNFLKESDSQTEKETE